MVIIKKPNGKVQISMDFRMEYLQLPASESIIAGITKSPIYTVLDAKSAFWITKLDGKSSSLLTMSTPYGYYRFYRLPFDPSKLEAIQKMEIPMDKTSLQRFLGTMNYLAKFMPNFADKTVLLRQLLKKDTPWTWNEDIEKEFIELKNLVSNPPVLSLFDPHGKGLYTKGVAYAVKPYGHCKEELYIWKDLLCRGQRFVIPKVQRKGILQTLHMSHQGISACKNRTHEAIYWPGLDRQIEEMVYKCRICQESQPSQRKEPLLPHEIANYPWQKVAIDFFYLDQFVFIIIVDYYSRYLEVIKVS
ncbi:K02A2.6-like [Cordylochernes scorpioides]|uniref:RNA-directed DNA polymerase n=1 Tax=Cordylochernes scorpioides TaxID=51811 RepID=A0ABY6LNG2_9ARAC|nr:K02A2.6-like [Cordylochernes scorpioides]